jgi:predicted dehydrogenase
MKAAVVGSGFIGSAHVEALRRIGVEVGGVVGSSAERARAAAADMGVPAFTSLEAALADPTIDAVHLATPNHLHYAQARAVLDAGKHVVCEKPLALTSDETADLVARADHAGLVNAVCFVYRFFPLNREARAMVGSGALGRPWVVHGSYHQDWLLLDSDWNWRLDPMFGGALRAVGDIGSHWLDLIEWILGDRITAVIADLSTFLPVRRHPAAVTPTFGGSAGGNDELVEEAVTTEDAAGVLLRFAGGARGTLSLAQVVAGRKNMLAYEVAGSRAAAAWRSEAPEGLWIGHRERANETLLRDPGLLGEDARRDTVFPGGHAEGFPDAFAAMFRAVYASVGAGRPPLDPGYPTFRDGHRAVLLGELIARSASEERWVNIDDPEPRVSTTTTGARTP